MLCILLWCPDLPSNILFAPSTGQQQNPRKSQIKKEKEQQGRKAIYKKAVQRDLGQLSCDSSSSFLHLKMIQSQYNPDCIYIWFPKCIKKKDLQGRSSTGSESIIL